MRQRVGFIAVMLTAILCAPNARAQDPDSAFDFWLSRNFVRSLADNRGLFYSMRLNMDHRTNKVHDLAGDCELHIASTATDSQQRFWPKGIVVEPPSLCQTWPPGATDDGNETNLRDRLWPDYLDANVMGRQCDVVGFPRLFSEHAAGSSGPTNPNHVFEIHPAMKITCDATHSLDASEYLKAFPKLRAVKPKTAADCLDGRELWVRKKAGSAGRYEFKESGGGSCGNFMIVEATAINPEWIKALPNGGGHSALARVRVDERGPFTVKVYSYPKSPADKILSDIADGADLPDHLHLHGMLTYDFFAILKAVQANAAPFGWLTNIPTWKRVSFPLALVMFGDIEVEEPEDPDGD
jgi:hypothetical protein